MPSAHRSAPPEGPDEDAPGGRYDGELNTGFPAWMRLVALGMLVLLVLATVVTSLL